MGQKFIVAIRQYLQKGLENFFRINKKMKTFKELREAAKGKMPKGEAVFTQKVNRVHVAVQKSGSKFVVYIDGERLDDYNNLNQAKKMGLEFAKEASK